MFLANERTECLYCKGMIEIGQPIKWSRKTNGAKYHPACEPILVSPKSLQPIAPVVTEVPTPVAMPTPVVANNISAPKPYELPEYRKLTNNSAWWEILAQLTRSLDRILIVGPPSSGKSTTAIKTLGVEHRVTMTPNTSREDLCGMFQLIGGQTIWIDGPITKAMRAGQPVLIDEIDRCGAEVESLMYSIIDDKPHLSLSSGELVNAARGFKVLMTSNVAPDALEPAVVDRMPAILFAFTPHCDALTGVRESLAILAKNHYRMQSQPRLSLSPTVRRVRAFESLLEAKIPARIAANVVFGPNAGAEVMSCVANIEASEAK